MPQMKSIERLNHNFPSEQTISGDSESGYDAPSAFAVAFHRPSLLIDCTATAI